MRIIMTGATGQLGRALIRQRPAGTEITTISSSDLNLADARAVLAAVTTAQPDMILHCGAMTDVDGCERLPEAAYRANALATQNVAAAAQGIGAALVYISTNYVFDGEADHPYNEFADPRPLSVYGHTKLAGERAVRALCPRHYIVRTAMLYDETGRNFVNTMLRLAHQQPELAVVEDQVGNPTYAGDLAAAVWRLVQLPAFGTYHLVNEGVTSWHGWATEIMRLAGRATPVRPIPSSAFQRAARPPRNGALVNTAAAAMGIALPPWPDALARCLAARPADTFDEMV